VANKKTYLDQEKLSKELLATPDYKKLFTKITECGVRIWEKKNNKNVQNLKHPTDSLYKRIDFIHLYGFLIRLIEQENLSLKDFKNEINDNSALQWRTFDQGRYRNISPDKVETGICTAAKFLNIPLAVLLAKFLEECETHKIRLASYQAFEKIIPAFLQEAKSITPQQTPNPTQSHTNENDQSPVKKTGITPSQVQPDLTIKQAKENDLNYYASTALDVLGREEEEKLLKDFLLCDMNVAWYQLAGVAGQGKSRLAFDLILHADDKLGWNAGLLEENGIRSFKDKWQTWQPDRPHLIVFDYVVGREDEIKPILQDLTYRQGQFLHPIRILLVERQRWDKGISFSGNSDKGSDEAEFRFASMQESKAEWFLNLCQNNDYDGSDHNFHQSRFDNGVLELENLDEDKLVQIVTKISEKIPDAKLTASEQIIKETLNRIDKSGRPLYAYFLGQELAHNTNTQNWSRDDLLKTTLTRERAKWWASAFKDENPPFLEDDIPASRLAVLATMTDGINCKEAHKSNLIPKAEAQTRRQALAMTGSPLTKETIDGPAQHIPAMQPDLLGEWYVIASFEAEGPPMEELTSIAWQYAPEKMSSFMQRLSQDFWDHPSVNQMLRCVNSDLVDVNTLSKVANALIARLHTDGLAIPDKVIQALLVEAKNNPASMNGLGYCYQYGIGVEKNINEAVAWYRKAADAGNVDAMLNIGSRYMNGIDVRKDMREALAWYRKAADAGNVDAIVNLGVCYHEGTGVKQNIDKAIKYYQKANELGNSDAMLNLGICHLNGTGVEKNIKTALRYILLAIKSGNTDAMTNLGICYEDGNGVEQDINEAIAWYRRAAERGNKIAMFNLGVCYQNGTGIEQDMHKAVEHYRKAADAGNAVAMLNLGFCYEGGNGVEKNVRKAAKYYQLAAEAGNTDAMFNLGICYQNGTGVEQNFDKAIKYFQKSPDTDNEMAKQNLVNLQLAMNLLKKINDKNAIDVDWAEKQATNILTDEWPDTLLKIGEWNTPSPDETIQILSHFHRALRTSGMLGVSDRDYCRRIRALPLSFYPKHSLVDIEFFSPEKEETRFCSVLVGPNGATPLNGEKSIIHIINETLLSFDAKNSSENYLRFYCNHTRNDDGPFHIISNLNDIKAIVNPRETLPDIFKQTSFTLQHIEGEIKTDGWQSFKAYMLHDNLLFTSTCKVLSNGRIGVEFNEAITRDLPVLRRKYNGIFRSPLQ